MEGLGNSASVDRTSASPAETRDESAIFLSRDAPADFYLGASNLGLTVKTPLSSAPNTVNRQKELRHSSPDINCMNFIARTDHTESRRSFHSESSPPANGVRNN